MRLSGKLQPADVEKVTGDLEASEGKIAAMALGARGAVNKDVE